MPLIVIGVIGILMGPVSLLVTCLWATWMYHACVVDGNVEFVRSFSFLFSRYHPWRYYFGLVNLLHNLALSIVPVVIADDIAGQIVCMAVVLLSFILSHAYARPYRIKGGNEVYIWVLSSLLLILILNAVYMDDPIESGTVEKLSILMASGLAGSLLAFSVWATCRVLLATPWYAYFVCHAKRSAGCFARLLQIKLQQRTKRPFRSFIDSDDLVNLNLLFDIVRTAVGHLVVVLNNQTLTRPWCSGEITTAVRNKVPVIVLRTTDYMAPGFQGNDQNAGVDEVAAGEDGIFGFSYHNSGLAAFGIEKADVGHAYRVLLSMRNSISLPPNFIDKEINKVVDRIGLQTQHIKLSSHRHRSGGQTVISKDYFDGDLIIVSDFSSMEANSSILILHQKIFQFVRGKIVSFPTSSDEDDVIDAHDFTMTIIDSFQQDMMTPLVDTSSEGSSRRAKAKDLVSTSILVFFSDTFLYVPECLLLTALGLEAAHESSLIDIVPVVLPFFEFPGNDYFEKSFTRILRGANKDVAEACEISPSQCLMSLKAIFKIICVTFNTQANDPTIVSASLDVLRRAIKGSDQALTRTLTSDLSSCNSSMGLASHASIGGRRACPGKCGYEITWHPTHCCEDCKEGSHSEKCDQKLVDEGDTFRELHSLRFSTMSRATVSHQMRATFSAAGTQSMQSRGATRRFGSGRGQSVFGAAFDEETRLPCASGCGYQATWRLKYCCYQCEKQPLTHGPKCWKIPMTEDVIANYEWTAAGCEWMSEQMVMDLQEGDVVTVNTWVIISPHFDRGWREALEKGYIRRKEYDHVESESSGELGAENCEERRSATEELRAGSIESSDKQTMWLPCIVLL
jgi:hypothetical protein